jgi:hypothetical protein
MLQHDLTTVDHRQRQPEESNSPAAVYIQMVSTFAILLSGIANDFGAEVS